MQRFLIIISLMLCMVTYTPAQTTEASLTPDPTDDVLTRENVSQLAIQNEFTLDMNLYSLTYSPDGQFIAFGTSVSDTDIALVIMNSTTGETVNTYAGHTISVIDIAYSPDGTRIASSSIDKTVRVWDVQTGEQVVLFDKHNSEVFSIDYHPSGNWIASSDFAGKVLVWDANTGEVVYDHSFRKDSLNAYATSLAFSPDGNFLAIGTIGSALNIWDWDSGIDPINLSQPEHPNPISDVAYGNYVVTGSFDETVRIWDDLGVKQILEGHEARVTGVAISPNSQLVISVSWDNMLKIWDVETGELIKDMMLVDESSSLQDVTISPDGRFIAVISAGDVFILGIPNP